MKKTHNCGELRLENVTQRVVLSGWVHKYRNLGGLLFIDLRDRYGITQVIFDPEIISSDLMDKVMEIRNEFVITIEGVVQKKPQANIKLTTGEIEILADNFLLNNKSITPPFNFIDDNSAANEDLRLKYRYLDLRSRRMVRNMTIRHKVMLSVRNFLSDEGFLEIETPTFGKSTPEGARDYLVPARLFPGMFYALPQSPQIYKQLLMVSGLDKYFQIARCYRDEDARGDRQPEFTQIDIEKSFTDKEEIFDLTERMMNRIFKDALNFSINSTFPRITFYEAMEKYGVDKPDLRFELLLFNISDINKKSSFKVFKDAEAVKGIYIPDVDFSRKEIKVYEDYAKHLGALGLAFVAFNNGKLEKGISKFLSKEEVEIILKRSKATQNGMIFFVADELDICNKVLGNLRNKIAKDLDLYDRDAYKFCWITDFPMFEYDKDEKRWSPMHHMFTMPRKEDLKLLDTDPGMVLSDNYDLVLNGVELASGSIRIHEKDIQKKIFKVLQMTEEEIDNKFGFMLKAFEFGAPPHGGIAPGLDRLVQVMLKETSIREVIAFPKAKNLNCPMMDAPSTVDKKQLLELGISIEDKE